jgi:hypothetical protein
MSSFLSRCYTTAIHNCVIIAVNTVIFILWVQLSGANVVIQVPSIEHTFKPR